VTRSWLALALALAAGCSSDPTGGSLDGATIYAEACARCHGPRGQPTAQMVQTLAVRDLTEASMRERISVELVFEQVRKGSPNRLMPSFVGALTEAQMKSVAAYVASPDFLQPAR
jgi:mono/diheme cytochrome c family protein